MKINQSIFKLLMLAILIITQGCAEKDTVSSDYDDETMQERSTAQDDFEEEDYGRNMEDDDIDQERMLSDQAIEEPWTSGQEFDNTYYAQAGLMANRDYIPRATYYSFDSYQLNAEGKEIAHRYYNKFIAMESTNAMIHVDGHCDERGTSEYNFALGLKRAKAFKEMLVILGIPPEKIVVKSYGKEKPAVRGHDRETYSMNRRAEIRIVE